MTYPPTPPDPALDEQPPDMAEFDALLDYLRRTRAVELSGYKRAGLIRRISKRMRAVGAGTFAAYRAYLEAHPDEFAQLVDALLINVTAFFRDDLPWEYLRTAIVPRLVAAKGPAGPVRVWCAGCATGEEAYTLAIVLCESLGFEAFRERAKIYATDLDEDALLQARHGAYSERDVADVPAELRERYFERHDQRLVFRRDLRRTIIFGRNDLLQDAPISRIDLLACRNTLMYFDAPTQAKVLARLHFALNDDGYLFLGRAETLLTHSGLFAPIDLRRRVFAKVPRPHGRDRQLLVPCMSGVRGGPRSDDGSDRTLDEMAFDAGTIAQLVVDAAGRLALVNARARSLFLLGEADVGRPLQDLEVSHRPCELRSLIDQAYAEARTVTRAEVPWRASSRDQRWFEIVVAPLGTQSGHPDGAAVSFVETTRRKQLQHQIEESQAELEAAYQELQGTSEELQTITDDLRVRGDELDRLNAFLESVFTSVRAGVVVLDRERRVLVWNRRAEDLWGLRADEVEHAHFVDLDIGLPVGQLAQPIREALAGDLPSFEALIPCTNRRGRPVECRVTIVPLLGRGDERPRGVIVQMEEQPTATTVRAGRDGEGTSP